MADVFTIGYLPIEPSMFEFPPDIEYILCHIIKPDNRVNWNDHPLFIRMSESWERYQSGQYPTDYAIKQLHYVTLVSLRELQHKNIIDDVVLIYKFKRDLWDMQIICAAFKQPEGLFIKA